MNFDVEGNIFPLYDLLILPQMKVALGFLIIISVIIMIRSRSSHLQDREGVLQRSETEKMRDDTQYDDGNLQPDFDFEFRYELNWNLFRRLNFLSSTICLTPYSQIILFINKIYRDA